MGSEKLDARAHFDAASKQWDSVYSHESIWGHALNRLLRKAVFERFHYTFHFSGDVSGATVLDIGCGSGRFAVEFAKRGAARVVGLDFAPAMIEYANAMAEKNHVADRCEFICGDFLQLDFSESFDIVVAMGFFDYVEAPAATIDRAASLTRRTFLASFPAQIPIWSSLRKARYHYFKKCPVWHYSAKQLEELFERAPFGWRKILPISRGFFVAAGP